VPLGHRDWPDERLRWTPYRYSENSLEGSLVITRPVRAGSLHRSPAAAAAEMT
jgi:hypothetical protein